MKKERFDIAGFNKYKRDQEGREAVGVVLGVLLIFVGIPCMIWFTFFPTEDMKKNQAQQQEINRIEAVARKAKDDKFCEEYKKITEPQNAPYAYKHCWESN